MLTALIGPIASLAGTWLDGKVEEKKAQSATKVAKAQAEAIVMQKKAINIPWELSLPLLLAYVQLQNSLVRSNDSCNGKSAGLENPAATDDDYDVCVRLACR